MALINCPECATKVSSKADKCPNCAYPLKGYSNVKTEGCFMQTLNIGCFLIGLSIALIVLFVLYFIVFENK